MQIIVTLMKTGPAYYQYFDSDRGRPAWGRKQKAVRMTEGLAHMVHQQLTAMKLEVQVMDDGLRYRRKKQETDDGKKNIA